MIKEGRVEKVIQRQQILPAPAGEFGGALGLAGLLGGVGGVGVCLWGGVELKGEVSASGRMIWQNCREMQEPISVMRRTCAPRFPTAEILPTRPCWQTTGMPVMTPSPVVAWTFNESRPARSGLR